MSAGWFIAGTDTGVGKTHIACALIHALRAQRARVVGMKPVASGAAQTPDGLRQGDVVALLAAAGIAEGDIAARDVNPYLFAPAIAPHIAARAADVEIDVARITAAYRRLATQYEYVVVEGAGGWRTPIGACATLAAVAQALQVPVILVVGLRLGCLNHALLTAEAIAADGVALAGWIGNELEPDMPAVKENIATLEQCLPAPCLGIVPYATSVANASTTINADLLLSVSRLL